MDNNDAIIKRIMPHDMAAEQSVIGSMLIDQRAIDVAAEIIRSDDFYAKQNGVLFDAMLSLRADGKPADPVTLSDKLKQMGAPEEMCSAEFIKEILAAVPTSANVKHYAQIVYEKSTLRSLIRITEDVGKTCYEGSEKLDDILEKTEKDIFDLLQSRNTREFEPITEVVMRVLKKIEEAAKSPNLVTGLSTGFTDLDNMTTGLQPSDFVLIAARPSMGKTAFALSLADFVAFNSKEKGGVAIFSLEMSKDQLVRRLLSMEARIDAQKIRTGQLEDNQWEDLMNSSEVIGQSKLIIDDTPGITLTELRSKCRRYKLEHDIQMVIIDYIQLMSSGNRFENRQQEISDISRGLKALARELNVPVVVLSQLNRAADSRTDHRPLLSDIRESGAIEQDADLIMFLYRDDYYNPETEDKNVAEVIIAKQRNGPVGTVKLTWQPQYTRFVNSIRKLPAH